MTDLRTEGCTVSRTELAGDARFAIERLGRALRDALPGSVRVSGGCVEHIPVLAGSTYLTLPLAVPATSFLAVPVAPLPMPAGARVAVYPTPLAYQLGAVSTISPPVALSGPDAGNQITVTMAAAHRFPVESPSNRFFLVSDPVSHCVDGQVLWRYRNYGFSVTQPLPASLPAGLPNRAMVAQEVTSPAPFSVSGATLTRNAVVDINMTFERGGDAVTLQHLVQVRNVP